MPHTGFRPWDGSPSRHLFAARAASVMASALLVAACGGGEVSQHTEPQVHPAVFDLRATARWLFTQDAVFEARAVGATTPSGRLELRLQPSSEQVRVGASLLEPRSVDWITTYRIDGTAGAGAESRCSFVLGYTPYSANGSYDRETGLIGFHRGAVEDLTFDGADFQYLRPVTAGGWRGEHNTFLARDIWLSKVESGQLYGSHALFSVRVTPVETRSTPTQAWFCVKQEFFAPGRYLLEPASVWTYCWLIGTDGQARGPFRASFSDPTGTTSFEGAKR